MDGLLSVLIGLCLLCSVSESKPDSIAASTSFKFKGIAKMCGENNFAYKGTLSLRVHAMYSCYDPFIQKLTLNSLNVLIHCQNYVI